MDKDDRSSSACDGKQHAAASSSTNQSGTGTPTPQQSQNQAQIQAVDDGPQEFVPGKKWEWRDPNKVTFFFLVADLSLAYSIRINFWDGMCLIFMHFCSTKTHI
ncbi:unnamed protein product [Gongylonema pulchrum]|uniref:SC4AB n=1 Tax=Gongylonema pulchrum TaxID=637853 RepID=A0A183EIS2_9BILA|nr:unnamed protein product [Gongylonema pulchrum]